ncbi:hypothetical protein Tco_0052481 [Tanacetum coccineum]
MDYQRHSNTPESIDYNTNVVNDLREPLRCQSRLPCLIKIFARISRQIDVNVVQECGDSSEWTFSCRNAFVKSVRKGVIRGGREFEKKEKAYPKTKSMCAVVTCFLFLFDDEDDFFPLQSLLDLLDRTSTDNSLKMGDEHLDTIPATESDEVIKSSVENLVPIPSEFEGISDDSCDIDLYFEEFAETLLILPQVTEDIEYISLEEVEQEEKKFDLEDIFQVQDVILREKLLNVHRLISNIKSLKVNSTPDRVLESPSPFPIPVVDSDAFFEESDTSLSHLDNSLPEFETFSDHSEETRSGSTTTHANYSLPEYESFYFDNPSFSRPPPEPPDIEKSFEPKAGILIIKEFKGVSKSHDFMTSIYSTCFRFTLHSLCILRERMKDTIFDPWIVILLRARWHFQNSFCSKLLLS